MTATAVNLSRSKLIIRLYLHSTLDELCELFAELITGFRAGNDQLSVSEEAGRFAAAIATERITNFADLIRFFRTTLAGSPKIQHQLEMTLTGENETLTLHRGECTASIVCSPSKSPTLVIEGKACWLSRLGEIDHPHCQRNIAWSTGGEKVGTLGDALEYWHEQYDREARRQAHG